LHGTHDLIGNRGQVFFYRLRGVGKVDTFRFSLTVKQHADHLTVKLEAKRRRSNHVKLLYQPRGQFNDFGRKVYWSGRRRT